MNSNSNNSNTVALPAAETMRATLRQKITEGRLAPGSRLFDKVLAEEFGVSRNTARDALRLLTTDGLVVSIPNSGSSVRILTPADIRDIYSARRLIETGAIAQSSTASDELLQKIEVAATQSEQYVETGDWNKVGTSSLSFHRSIVQLTRSQLVDEFFTTLAAQLRLAFALMPDESVFQVSWVGRDRNIANLILSGRREEATSQLIDYLNESEAQIIDGVRNTMHSRSVMDGAEKAS
ncbi:GntR family transcriptional regulator [Neomicrococcus lactis]|uniref:GntR family transcriptional regulator n=1 Tax=Neomicrococcus lactis TaxID=732241 RepID=UPI002301443B|nr:GntR family transcriptional regulator [Neomicrococcus lactis]